MVCVAESSEMWYSNGDGENPLVTQLTLFMFYKTPRSFVQCIQKIFKASKGSSNDCVALPSITVHRLFK